MKKANKSSRVRKKKEKEGEGGKEGEYANNSLENFTYYNFSPYTSMIEYIKAKQNKDHNTIESIGIEYTHNTIPSIKKNYSRGTIHHTSHFLVSNEYVM